MPTLYQALVFVHILMAVVWVGGAVTMQALAVRAQRSPEPGETARLFSDVEWIGTRMFMPSSLILLGAGVWAVLEGPWELSQGWISAGFAVWFLSFAVGAGFMGPESGRIKALVREHGPLDDQVKARINRVLLVSRVELVLLIAIIYIMVAKPWL
jgi:uncharacterized membrane protein